jgi:hypothetical protein
MRPFLLVALITLFTTDAAAQETLTDAPTFAAGYLWRQVVFQGTVGPNGEAVMSHGDIWGGRVVAGLGLGRFGVEMRLDASGLKDQFDPNNPATFKSIEGFVMGHYVAFAKRGVQLGPAVVLGSISSFEQNSPWSGFGVDVAGGGLRVGGYGSEVEVLGLRTDFLRGDPGWRLAVVAHIRVTSAMTIVGDAVSGPAGYVRGGIAVQAFGRK